MAAESPYPGERRNARTAARRLAASHEMSLDEAVRAGIKPAPPECEPEVDPGAGRWQGHGGFRKRDYYTEEAPDVDWLRQYARARQADPKKRDDPEVRLLLLCLIAAIVIGLVGLGLVSLASRISFLESIQNILAAP